jgi:hypothetical protein
MYLKYVDNELNTKHVLKICNNALKIGNTSFKAY